MFNFKKEKIFIIIFFTVLTIILTWPVAWRFFSSVPSSGPDTMQVIGVAGEKANLLSDQGLFRGTVELVKKSEFNITALYAYFQLIFGRIVGYNLLFFLSFILSGLGGYLLAFYFTKNKPASLLAGTIFAFSPFHIHNSLSTNVGTMHQEWLPFFALYLFKFFEDLSPRHFFLTGFFLFLIGFTEHQMLAFTIIFILFFLIYKIITQPKTFLRPKLWVYIGISVLIFSGIFFFMFRSLFVIAGSENNFLDPGFETTVKYSNDSLAIIIPPNFHSLWPKAFSGIRNQFKRNSNSSFSVYAGYTTLLLSLFSIGGISYLKKKQIPTRGMFFWLTVAIGFYILSLGPYLHYKGVLDPPIKMPYYLVYQYLPFYKNIRTVGRFFIWSMVGFSLLAAWGSIFLQNILQKAILKSKTKTENKEKNGNSKKKEETGWKKNILSIVLYSLLTSAVIVEFLAIPLKTDSLLHSPFYEKIGQDKENYSVLEVPGSTSYNFASRDLVWRSIHRKSTINHYDFARVNKKSNQFQRSTPIIRTLLYDIPEGNQDNDSDIMKDSYYDIASEILNYYNIRWIILDKEHLKGNPEKNKPNMFYSAKTFVSNIIKCAEEYEDNYLYACRVNPNDTPKSIFLAPDFSTEHWVKKGKSKKGIKRWAENGAGIKLVNMSDSERGGRLKFCLKVDKPLRVKIFLNKEEVYNQYVTSIGKKQEISVDLRRILPGENIIVFGIYAADNSEIYSDKKSETVAIYQVDLK